MADNLQRTFPAAFAAAAEGIPVVRSSVVLFFWPAQPSPDGIRTLICTLERLSLRGHFRHLPSRELIS